MKIHLILCAAVAALIIPVSADSDTELGEKMDFFNDAYKSFRREKDPAKGAVTAREAQLLIAKALTLTPDIVNKMPDGPEKIKAAAAYRRMMGEVYVLICKVEEAYLAGDMEEVAKLYGGLKDLKKVGHDKFMEE